MFNTSSQQLPCDVLCSRLSSNRSRQLVGYGGRDCAVHVFPFAGYTPVARLEGLTAPVTALAFSPDQASVVAGSDTGGLQLWDLATEQRTRTFQKGHSSTVTDLAFHSSGHLVASVSTDTVLRLWDTRRSTCVQPHKDANAPLCAVQFSLNGQWVVTGCARGIVRVYNLRKGRVAAKLELHTGAITSLCIHSEMYLLAVGSGDATVSVWNFETCSNWFHSDSIHTPVDSVEFCGDRLLAASDRQLHIYDLRHPTNAPVVREAPWAMIGDMVYVSFSDEAWFVECNGSTATTGRMRLSGGGDDNGGAAPPKVAQPLRQQHPPVSNRVAGAAPSPKGVSGRGGEASPVRTKAGPPPPEVTVTTSVPVRARAQPTIPRGQPQAAQEYYAAEKPRVTNDTPFKSDSRDGLSAVDKAFRAAAPEIAEVPFVDEGGDEMDVVGQLIATSSSFEKLLHRRLTHLRAIRSLWSQDQRGAVEYLRQVCEAGSEAGPVYDFLTAMQQQRMKEKMPIDALPDLLDVIQCSLNSSHDPLLLVALRTLRSMNTKFRARIDEGQRRNRLAQSNGHNDPLGMNNADGCIQRFGACSVQVTALSGRRDAIGEEARYLVGELPPPPRQ